MKTFLAAAGVALSLAASVAAAPKGLPEPFSGQVVRVLDGDTVEVLRSGKNGGPQRLRLFGIDAPERRQDHSREARKLLGELVYGKTIKVLVRDRDRYGRWVSELTLDDGRNVNLEMVRAGYAWWYERYAPKDAALKEAQAEAQAARRGLWKDERPIEPALFRKSSPQKREPVM